MGERMMPTKSECTYVPRVFREMPQFIGPIHELPVELRNPHMLHVTVLKNPLVVPFVCHTTEVVSALQGQVNAVSALGSEEFYSGWCLTYGTLKMFENSGTILLQGEKVQKLNVPAVVGDSWGLGSKRITRGAKPYSGLEIATHQNLGAQIYRLERLVVGALRRTTEGNPAIEAQVLLEGYLQRFKTTARGTTRRSQDTDHAFRRLRNELGPNRLRVLYAASLGDIRARFDAEGASIAVPSKREDGWERHVPELAREFEKIAHLLALCHRASRLRNFIDRNIDLGGLEHPDDPVVFMPERSAEELLGFGSEDIEDRMPDLSTLTLIALDFDFNAAELFPSLGPLGLHLAAACALGRESRGTVDPKTPAELWGLRGLAGERFDAACFPELQAARHLLRSFWSPPGNAGNVPPFLTARDVIHNVPIVLKPDRK